MVATVQRQTIENVFASCKKEGKTAFIAYLTCGYPFREDTVSLLLSLQEGGAHIIEVGIPFSDPQADGPTIQKAHQIGVKQNISLKNVLDTVEVARKKGLHVPVILMGYYNTFLAFGMDQLGKQLAEKAVEGVLIVDLPMEESVAVREDLCASNISFITLIAPTTPNERIAKIAKISTGFIYCVTIIGVTGVTKEPTKIPIQLQETIQSIRKQTNLPIVLGFGLSTKEDIDEAGKYADGAVIGSQIVKVIDTVEENSTEKRVEALKKFCMSIVGKL